MPALFDEGFFVRKPAWHELGIVLEEYPGREEASILAGHDYEIVESPIFDRVLGQAGSEVYRTIPDYKQLVVKGLGTRPDGSRNPNHGKRVGVLPGSYTAIQNSIPWDVIDAMVELPNVHYETGATLDDGKQCFVTAWVDEPMEIPGDDSPIYPYIAANWRHDGLGAFRLIKTNVREVCANTVAMAEAQAEQTGLNYTFRHTKNVHDRIEEAKLVLAGLGGAQSEFMELATELGQMPISNNQREFFISQFLPSPAETLISERVQKNLDEARGKVRTLLDSSPTIPDAHRDTGYGLFMAGTEYLDHLRGYRNHSTYVGRTLLRREPLKDKLLPLIRETVEV